MEAALLDYYDDIRAIHTHYSTLGNVDLESERGATNTFTMDKGELTKLIKDCCLIDEGTPLTKVRELSHSAERPEPQARNPKRPPSSAIQPTQCLHHIALQLS